MNAIAAIAAVLIGAAPAAASGVVRAQFPDGTGRLMQSSWFSPDGSDYDQIVWDAFSFPADTLVTEIIWEGGHIYPGSPFIGPLTGFEIHICPSIPAGIQPDILAAPLLTASIAGTAEESPLGVFGGVGLYGYHAVLPQPFRATAGVRYWLRIVATQEGIPDWGLTFAANGDGKYFRRIAAVGDFYYQSPNGDSAFTLIGAPVCPGDLDGNRSVGANDLSLLLGLFGQSASAPPTPDWASRQNADIDGNGAIGANDLSILLANFGAVCP
ncbi:MAG: hypothetical protein IBJ11_06905 [Phycisphaerales bacterium]|nr:hypothetical protein [Phycisphaerales bacterium]